MKRIDAIMQYNHDYELGRVRELEAKRDDLVRVAKKMFKADQLSAADYIKICSANGRLSF